MSVGSAMGLLGRRHRARRVVHVLGQVALDHLLELGTRQVQLTMHLDVHVLHALRLEEADPLGRNLRKRLHLLFKDVLGLEVTDAFAAVEDSLDELADRHGARLTLAEDLSDLLAELMQALDPTLVLFSTTHLDAGLSRLGLAALLHAEHLEGRVLDASHGLEVTLLGTQSLLRVTGLFVVLVGDAFAGLLNCLFTL